MGAIERPEINEKVEVMFGVAPSVTFANMTAWFVYQAPFVKPYQVNSFPNIMCKSFVREIDLVHHAHYWSEMGSQSGRCAP